MQFRNSIVAVSVLGLACGTCWASEAAETKAAEVSAEKSFEIRSDNDKVLYSLGYELGEDLKRQDLELSRDALLKGVDDALEGSKPLVNRTGRSAALAEIREARAQDNLEKSQAFLAENALKKDVVTLESGLQYRVVRAGEGKMPQTTDTVLVNYRGTFIDGAEFDSSYGRGKPSSLRVSKVIKGWREALLLMKEGARWELYVPPDLAYGKRGRGKQIPPNRALIFDVELLKIE